MSEDFAEHLVIIWNQQVRVSSCIAQWAEAGWLLLSGWRLAIGFAPSYPSSFYLSPEQMLIPNKVILRLLQMMTHLLYCILMRNFEEGKTCFCGLSSAVIGQLVQLLKVKYILVWGLTVMRGEHSCFWRRGRECAHGRMTSLWINPPVMANDFMQTFAKLHTLFWKTGDQKQVELWDCRLMATLSLIIRALNDSLYCVSYFIQSLKEMCGFLLPRFCLSR